MRVTEENIQKVSDRVYGLRQQWRCRVKVKDIVHRPASVAFLLLSIVYSYSLLSALLLNDPQMEKTGFLKYLGTA